MSQKAKKKQLTIAQEKPGAPGVRSLKKNSSPAVHATNKKGTPPHTTPPPPSPPQEPFKEKYRGVPTSPPQVTQSQPSRIVLMDIDPCRFHAYWEICEGDKQKVLSQLDGSSHLSRLTMRVYDVTYIQFDGNNAHSYFDIKLDRDKGNWYIDLWSSHKSVCAEIGVKSAEGNFYLLARSNFIETPRAFQSFSGKERWMKVTGDYKEIAPLPAQPPLEKTSPAHTFLKIPSPGLPSVHHATPTQGETLESEHFLAPQERELRASALRETQIAPLPAQPPLEKTPPAHTFLKIPSPGLPSVHHATSTQGETLESEHFLTPQERELRAFALRETHLPHPHDQLQLHHPFIATRTPRENELAEEKISEDEVKAYYQRLLITGRRQEAKVRTTPVTHLTSRSDTRLKERSGEKVPRVRHTHYGSDIRWEEEAVRRSTKKTPTF